MATLWIREYGHMAYSNAIRLTVDEANGQVPLAQEPGTDQTPVTFSTSAQSAAFGAGTAFIRVVGSVPFHYVVGANPTATTNHLKWPADIPLEIGVMAGHKIAAVSAA